MWQLTVTKYYSVVGCGGTQLSSQNLEKQRQGEFEFKTSLDYTWPSSNPQHLQGQSELEVGPQVKAWATQQNFI